MTRPTDGGPGVRIRRLTVEPVAGLGNRLRVVASALALAERLGCPLRIVWTRTPDLGCRYDELFLPLAGAEVVERSRTASRVWRHIGSRLRYRPFLTQPDVERLLARGETFAALRQSRYPFIVTCSAFFPHDGTLARLVPADLIARAVREVTGRFAPDTIGVHIRRGDHSPARAHSPTAAFLALMEERLRRDPDAHFFLATDSHDEERALSARFGDRIVTVPKALDRGTPAGARGALIDLLCLAATTEIIGSYYSSFSEVAAEIGGLPLTVVRVTADC